jgi:hypothetical protein
MLSHCHHACPCSMLFNCLPPLTSVPPWGFCAACTPQIFLSTIPEQVRDRISFALRRYFALHCRARAVRIKSSMRSRKNCIAFRRNLGYVHEGMYSEFILSSILYVNCYLPLSPALWFLVSMLDFWRPTFALLCRNPWQPCWPNYFSLGFLFL